MAWLLIQYVLFFCFHSCRSIREVACGWIIYDFLEYLSTSVFLMFSLFCLFVFMFWLCVCSKLFRPSFHLHHCPHTSDEVKSDGSFSMYVRITEP